MVGIRRETLGTSSSIKGVGTNIGVLVAECTSFLASVAALNKIDLFSKLKLRYAKLKDCLNMVNILFEKKLSRSMPDKKKLMKNKERNEKRFTIF